MSDSKVLNYLKYGIRGQTDAESLDEIFKTAENAWGKLREAARACAADFEDSTVDWISARIDEQPGTAFAILLDLAGRCSDRAAALIARFRELMETRPAAALAAAGYNLFEYHHLIDERWIADARRFFEHDIEGAWGIMIAACSYESEFVKAEDVDWFEGRAATGLYHRMMFQLAESTSDRRDDCVRRALARFADSPEAALKAVAEVAYTRELNRPDIIEAILRHFSANPESAWKYFEDASYKNKPMFDDALLEVLSTRIATRPRAFFDILGKVASEAEPARARRLMEWYAKLLPSFPAEGIDAAYYLSSNERGLLCPVLIDAICVGFAASAYHAFDILQNCLRHRPELVQKPHIEAALANTSHATNWAFGFFRNVLEMRPEFTPHATMALFECLAMEPAHRAYVRTEELQSIINIAQASHVKTELERALKQPPNVGSRRARSLMAILFRQSSRSKQHVLFEALRYAATSITWANRNNTPLWDFAMFALDHPTGDAISTAAVEQLLEGAFQISYLIDRRVEHDAFISRFDLENLDPVAAPPGVDERLYQVVVTLSKRFGRALRIPALEEDPAEDARSELAAIERRLPEAQGELRRNLEKRIATLKAYRPNPKDVAKRIEKTLRYELSRIAVDAVETSRLELYSKKLKSVLGRDVDVKSLESSILPSFLFFGAIDGFPNNRKYLAKLIEDRIEKRPHDWMWTEPAVVRWKERVMAGQPDVAIQYWRAKFSKEYQYHPKDARAEKARRIKDDLAQAKRLLQEQGGEGFKDASAGEIKRVMEELKKDPEKKPDPRVLEEIVMNLERARIVADTPESDYAGRIVLEVETNPFEVLFMGEYGFASCLSLRGSSVWSAVSNAIDVDKTIIWARESGGNVVGRRLIALTPEGIVSYRTYANRHGLSLDGMFDDFIEAYARRCGTRWVRRGAPPGSLLSDRWYDDGAL